MSVTTHPFAPEEIMAFMDGELSADRTPSVSAHIDQCAECREARDSLLSGSQLLAHWTVASFPARLESDVVFASAKFLSGTEREHSREFFRSRGWSWRRWVLTLAGAACTVLLLIVIAAPNRLRSRMAHQEARDFAAWRAAHPGQSSEDFRTAPLTNSGDERPAIGEKGRIPVSLSLPGPMIARTVSLSMVVKDFEIGRASLDSILARHNGYAAGLHVATPQGAARTLQASLRIPAPQLVTAIAELKALGRVEAETQNGEEVTQQHADLLARLKNSRETEQRLQDVLRTRTGKVKDVLEVEKEIARVRGEIEQMEAEQQTLEHRFNFVAIDLRLAEEYRAELTTPAPSVVMQLRNALVDGFRTAFQSLLALVLFFAESGPTLLLWLMILSFPASLFWRRYQRSLQMGSSAGV